MCHQITSQSVGSGRRSHFTSCHLNRQLLLVIMMLASFLPFSQARHLHDQVAALDYATSFEDDSSGRERERERDNAAAAAAAAILASWRQHANPFHGLAESFGEGTYDSSSSSSSSDSGDFDSSSSSSSEMGLSENSYEEIAQAALRAARQTKRELHRRQRTRHARSHNLRLFSAPNPQIPEWENPCGGVYQPGDSSNQEDSSSQGRVIKRRHLLALRNNTMSEYRDIRSRAKLEYRDFQHWQHEYKFLPNMTRSTGAVKLKTWYRSMQTFVGSFAYLGKAQYKYRKDHQQSLDAVTNELHALLVSARTMLCEIETTINASYPNSNGAKLTRISREVMQERLKFHTPADGSEAADERDLKVTKELYLQYLENVFKTLHSALSRKHHRHPARTAAGGAAGAAAVAGTGSAGLDSGSLRGGSSESFELRRGSISSGSECASGEC
ncbi:uncharacterized protein LOC6505178 isoform X2 [Drosophila ananassae]|uniref:uncharacterized protein LOC6505178 isoform X2 n=1 Tax=Drosophila ananassae TaxID=7217 RepID=UPI0013A5E838|nr:uncharacterized protein LOC6505178 isoform X2 [Drosophila ananassae]